MIYFSLEFLMPEKNPLHFIFQEMSLFSCYSDSLVEFTEVFLFFSLLNSDKYVTVLIRH